MDALEPLQQALHDVCDPSSQLLYRGLGLLLEGITLDQLADALTAQVDMQLISFQTACNMVTAGATQMQPGAEPEKVGEAVRQAALSPGITSSS
jgi:hypothetical protein